MCVCIYIYMQDVPFIMSPGTTALSHIKPASAGTFRESRSTQRYDKGDILYIAILNIGVQNDAFHRNVRDLFGGLCISKMCGCDDVMFSEWSSGTARKRCTSWTFRGHHSAIACRRQFLL